jgi:hypothetical protein
VSVLTLPAVVALAWKLESSILRLWFRLNAIAASTSHAESAVNEAEERAYFQVGDDLLDDGVPAVRAAASIGSGELVNTAVRHEAL